MRMTKTRGHALGETKSARRGAPGRVAASKNVTMGVAALGAVACLAYGASAAAKPDLVIVERDSTLNIVSCEKNQPLATGLIAIKNIGDARAKMPLGVLSRFSRSMLAVYVPEHLDLIDNGYERSAMDPQDQESIRIEIGKGKAKLGRFPVRGAPGQRLDMASNGFGSSDRFGSNDFGSDRFGSNSFGSNNFGSASGSDRFGSTGGAQTVDLRPTAIVDTTTLTLAERQDIQRALRDIGYYSGPIDGMMGVTVETAVRSFQRSYGGGDGRLTVAQVRELSSQTGRSLAIGAVESTTGFGSNSGDIRRQAVNQAIAGTRSEITFYAVVDPYNLVDEADETNNLVIYKGILDCR